MFIFPDWYFGALIFSVVNAAAKELLIAHNNSLLSDEELLLLLLDENSSENPQFNCEKYERFDIDDIEEAECKAEFRVEKKDLHQLAEVLQLPNSFRRHQRTTADKLEGLCILLRKMSYPCRYSEHDAPIWKTSG